MARVFKVAVPAGIGDISWIWSKLSTIGNEFMIFTPETWPQRSYQWLHLLPNVIPMIGKHGYNDILTMESKYGYASYNSWEEILKVYGEDDVIYLQPNQHFLKGRPLSMWLPDLKTDYHYELSIPDEDIQFAHAVTSVDKAPRIGIHMSSMKGAKGWNAWMPEDWVRFMKLVDQDISGATFYLLGGSWDADMALEVIGRMNKEVKLVDMVGRTTIGQAIALLDCLDYYVGFSSGLNVMMNVMNKPCAALWPDYQRAHIYPHVDPDMVDSRRYVGFVYDDPERIYYRLKDIILEEVMA